MAKTKEELNQLKDEDLEKVSGGGNGYAENGITFSTYDMPEPNRYYSYFNYIDGSSNVYYVRSVDGNFINGSVEHFKTDGKNWSSTYYYNDLYTSIESFKKNHPYVLNVQP